MLIKQITFSTIFAVLASFATVANAGVSGFVDAQITSGSNDASNSPTAQVADAAVYFTDKLGSTSVTVDLPFKFSGTGTTNAFDFAMTKGQAYVTQGYDFGLSWSLGQWDKIFGFESNDNIDNRFTAQGILYGQMLVTHTGLLMDYTNGPVTVKAFAANSHSTGRRNGDNFDYGGQVVFKHEAMHVSGGYLHHKDRTTAQSSMLADFVLGWAGNNITADANVIINKAAISGAQTGFGVGGWFTYTMNAWNLGTRLEYGSKLPNGYLAATNTYSAFQWTIGPAYKFNEKLTAKLDYTLNSTKALQATTSATTIHTGTLSAQYRF